MSIRFKLTLGFVLAVLVANCVLALVTILSVRNVYFEEVQTRVRLELAAARASYEHNVEDVAHILHAVSIRRSIAAPLAQEARGDLGLVLRTLRRERGLDMLTLVDPQGRG